MLTYQTGNTLVVDIFIDRPSTAAAAANFVRCAMAAVGVVAMQPIVDRIGVGWFFTTLALICGILGIVCSTTSQRYGMKWRVERAKVAAGKC